ncbi:hypothetical protein BU15DRAFT_82086 [Melanogaster broomeanus]|nr:hypothetical protein BU15DRAFT_82086 [Melanogaster broomeanus]
MEADPSSSTSNAGKDHRPHPPYHHDSQWEHTKASDASPHIDEAPSASIGESQVDEANTLVQRQEHTEEIHPRLDDDAARQKADAKVYKEVKELRDIISLTSREPLERQTHPGIIHLHHVCQLWKHVLRHRSQSPRALRRMLVHPPPSPVPLLPLVTLKEVRLTLRDFVRTASHLDEPECPESRLEPGELDLSCRSAQWRRGESSSLRNFLNFLPEELTIRCTMTPSSRSAKATSESHPTRSEEERVQAP